MADRIRAAGVADMTSLTVRTVQALAASGVIPGAFKIRKVWTFDPAKVRAWIRQEEAQTCQARNPPPTSIKGTAYGGDILGTPAAAIDEAFEQLMRPKPRNGSKPGARA